MPRYHNLIGFRSGKLVVISFHAFRKRKSTKVEWLCKCDCGNDFITLSQNIKSGKSNNCGCETGKNRSKANTSHGMTSTPSHSSWKHMKNRCDDKNYSRYYDYGGRGISYCKEWSEFENFLKDMGVRPDGMSLDRKDNEKNYSKDNCKWSTPKEQMNNTRQNRLITWNGKTQNIGQWCEELGFKDSLIRTRLRRGWSIERTLTQN